MKGKGVWSSVIAVMFVLAVVMAGPGAAGARTGVTDDEILVGVTMDMSGPIAFIGNGVANGLNLKFRHVNDQGGIHGRRIRAIIEDDGYQSPRAVQAARKLVTRDGVFCMFLVMGSGAVNAMYPFLEARGIPLFFPVTQERSMAFPPRKYLFMVDATYTYMAKVGVEYFVEKLDPEDLRIAVIYQDDGAGHDWLDGVRIGASYFGLDIVAEQAYRRASVDFSSQVSRCRNADATHIFMYTIVREPAMIMREAQRQQYKATYVTSVASMNNTTLQLAGDAVDFSNGLWGFGMSILNFDDPPPALRAYMELAQQYGFDYASYADQPMTLGYVAAGYLVEGFRRAGRDLTREGMIKAVESFENVDNGITPPITYGPDRRDGVRAVIIGKARDRKWVSVLPEGETRTSKIPMDYHYDAARR